LDIYPPAGFSVIIGRGDFHRLEKWRENPVFRGKSAAINGRRRAEKPLFPFLIIGKKVPSRTEKAAMRCPEHE
jgi:hypothetical protein